MEGVLNGRGAPLEVGGPIAEAGTLAGAAFNGRLWGAAFETREALHFAIGGCPEP